MGRILIDLLKDTVYFPIWWYSRGLFLLLKKLKQFIIDRERGLALFIWIKNIFRPMYSQHDWAGLFISFFVRVFQIIFRSILMIFWLILAFIILLIWIIAPIFVIYQIIYQFT